MPISVRFLLEYERVLKRPEQLEVMKLSRRDIDTVLSDLFAVAREVNRALGRNLALGTASSRHEH